MAEDPIAHVAESIEAFVEFCVNQVCESPAERRALVEILLESHDEPYEAVTISVKYHFEKESMRTDTTDLQFSAAVCTKRVHRL